MENMENNKKINNNVNKNKYNNEILRKLKNIIFSPKKMRKDLEVYSKESRRYLRKLKNIILFVVVVVLSIQIHTTLINAINKTATDKNFPELIIKNGEIDINRQFDVLNNKKKEQEIVQKALNDVNKIPENKEDLKDNKKEKLDQNTKLEQILESEIDKRQIIDSSNNIKYIYIKKIDEDNSKLLEKNNIDEKVLDELYKKINVEDANSDLSKISINDKITKIIHKKQSDRLNKQLKDNNNNVILVIKKEGINVFLPYLEIPYSIDSKSLNEIGRYGAKNYSQNIITKEMVIVGFNSNTIKIMTIIMFIIILYILMYLILTLYLWIAKLFGEIVLKVLVVFKIFKLNTVNIKNILTYSLTLPLVFLCINLSSNIIYAMIPIKEILNISRCSMYISLFIYIIHIIMFAMIHKYIPLTKEEEKYIEDKNKLLNIK